MKFTICGVNFKFGMLDGVKGLDQRNYNVGSDGLESHKSHDCDGWKGV